MKLVKGSKNYVLASLNTIEKMLREVRAEVSQGADGVKPYPASPTNEEEKPKIYENLEIKTPKENELKGINTGDKEPNVPEGGFARESPKIYNEDTKMASRRVKADEDPSIAKQEKPAVKIYNETNQWVSKRNLLKASLESEKEIFGSLSLESQAIQSDIEFGRSAETSQGENGVNITTKDPDQKEDGVPVISPEVKTEKPAVEVHDDKDTIVNEKAVMKPTSTGDAEKDPKNGREDETPKIYDETKEMVEKKDLMYASRNKRRK